jgi:hypothetical protein
MSLFQKIAGFINSFVQIGGPSGSALKNNAGAIEHRNAGDTAFVNARGLDPVVAQDFVTLGYFNANPPTGSTTTLRMAVGTGASQSSVSSIPANAVVESVMLDVTTPFSGGATVSIGQTGSTALLMGTSDNFPQTAGQYYIAEDTPWGASALPLLITVGGAPSAGVAIAKVEFSVPEN